MANNLSLERTDRITGSRIAGVLGLSPYRTRADVMREMVREHHWADSEFDGNFITEFGEEHEADGVDDYELLSGNVADRSGDQQRTVVGGPNGEFAVTPDGVILLPPEGGKRKPVGVLEVKCPWRALYTSIWERPDYEAQVRLNIDVLGAEWGDFAVWREAGTSITRVHPDRDRDGHSFDWWSSKPRSDSDTVRAELDRFLEEYAATIELDEDDPQVQQYLSGRPGHRADAEWLAAAASFLDLNAELERIQRAVQEAKDDLEALTPGKTSKGAGVMVVYRRSSAGGTKGTVSWKNLAEKELGARGVTITPDMQDVYRGAPGQGGGRGTYAYKILSEDAP